MTNFFYPLPHEKLMAYQEARKLLTCIRDAEISDGRLRDQALRAGTSVCLNIAGGWTDGAQRARAVYALLTGLIRHPGQGSCR